MGYMDSVPYCTSVPLKLNQIFNIEGMIIYNIESDRKVKWTSDFIIGWAAGALGLIAGHPLDTIKVRQQSFTRGIGMYSATMMTFKYEGLFGFYKGLMFPLLMTGFTTSLYFGVFGIVHRFLQSQRSDFTMEKRFCCEGETLYYKGWHWDVFWSGCISGIAATILNTPVELVKSQLQVQTGSSKSANWMPHYEGDYKGPFNTAKRIYLAGGIRGLYRGFVALFWRDVPTYGIHILTFEHVVCMLYGSAPGNTITQIVAGSVAGAISWAPVVPLDVIKSRIQTDNPNYPQYKGTIDCALKIYRLEGMKVFFRGFAASLGRGIPSNAVTFVAYQYFASYRS